MVLLVFLPKSIRQPSPRLSSRLHASSEQTLTMHNGHFLYGPHNSDVSFTEMDLLILLAYLFYSKPSLLEQAVQGGGELHGNLEPDKLCPCVSPSCRLCTLEPQALSLKPEFGPLGDDDTSCLTCVVRTK